MHEEESNQQHPKKSMHTPVWSNASAATTAGMRFLGRRRRGWQWRRMTTATLMRLCCLLLGMIVSPTAAAHRNICALLSLGFAGARCVYATHRTSPRPKSRFLILPELFIMTLSDFAATRPVVGWRSAE